MRFHLSSGTPRFSRLRIWLPLLILCMIVSGCSGGVAPSISETPASVSATPDAALPAPTPETTPEPSPEPSPTPTPAPTPEAMAVKVDTSLRQQEMAGFGGNYCQVMYTGTALDDIGKFTLETLRPHTVRIPLMLDRWDPDRKGDAGYRKEDPRIVELTDMIRLMHDTHGVSHFVGSIWDAAPWMVESEDGSTGGIIPEALYPDTAASLVALLVHIRETTGVEIGQISINEPDIGVNVKMGSESLADFIRVTGPMLDKSGLQTKFLVGDVSQPSPTTQYMETLLGTEDIAPWLGDIAYHSWNSSTMSNALLSDIRTHTAQTDRTLLVTEFGYNPGLWKTPEEFPTWQHAWFVANTLYRNIKFAGAQLILYWEWENDYPLLSPTLEPYPAWHVLLQTMDALPDGITVVDSQSENEARLGTLAAAGEGDAFSLLLLNKTPKDLSVVISGAPEIPLAVEISSEDHYREGGGQVMPEAGIHTVIVPAKSYMTLRSAP